MGALSRHRKPGVFAAEKISEAVVRNSRTSFYWAMRVLPRNKRMAMYAIYAFCRLVDDIADGSDQEAEKMRQLRFWRDELESLYQGSPTEPVCIALLQPIQSYGLAQKDFVSVIEGMERDARSCVRIADERDLASYCDAVACSVGRLANQVFGVNREAGNAIAAALGQALQLTNILRDIAEDAACDRLYLPRDLLLRHGIDSDDPTVVISQPGLAPACRELAETALRHYETAEQLIRRHERSALRPAVLMMQTYRRVLFRLQKRGWDDIERRVSLSRFDKILIMLRYGLLSL